MPVSKIIPYRAGSVSARLLSEALGIRRLKIDGTSRWRPRGTVLNWGMSSDRWPFEWDEHDVDVLNPTTPVSVASCKLTSARWLTEMEVATPHFMTDQREVAACLEDGHTVLARTLLRASGRRGIVKLEGAGVDIPNAPLYTIYVPKQSEWRVHAWGGRVIDIQRKIARPGVEPADWQIRNHSNGFIFQRDWNRDMWHDELADEAIKAVEAFGLDFGAVDVIWNEHWQQAYVLEVNTAPGLEGETLNSYVQAIREFGDE